MQYIASADFVSLEANEIVADHSETLRMGAQ
jgi:hypothetical protein